MPSSFFLVGPTAVGKSSLALEIAERSGAEIVGADAFQIYTGLDLLTAKPATEARARVPHHLVGCLPLSSEYNVARYLEDAHRCLDEIAARGRPALIVGGSGLYVRALTHGLSPLPPTRPELRVELESCDLPALTARLGELDPAALGMIDAKNKRRLIRAIEICEGTGRPFSAARTLWDAPSSSHCASQGFLLTRERTDMLSRIHRRAQALVASGVLEEVKAESGTAFSSTSSKIIGLADLRAHLRGELGLAESVERIEIATRRYAKRQMTWFRGKCDFESVDLTTERAEDVIARTVASIQRLA